VADGVWTFKRDGGSVSLERRLADDEIVLAVRHQEDLRLFAFPDLHALIRFQEDMETFLLRTGWTLASFSPERRQLADRRSFPRVTNDRRRWWTDGVPD
jgi:hypothetical protein